MADKFGGTSYNSNYNNSINSDYGKNSTIAETADYHKPKGVLDALSEIQRYHIFEKNISEEMPKEFFTIGQIFDFLIVGIKSGILEGLLFISFLPFIQIIYPEFKYFFYGIQISTTEMNFLISLSFIPIIISTFFMVFLTKYYEGGMTKRAIFSLLNGRSIVFLIKACLFYILLTWLHNKSFEGNEVIYSIIDYFTWIITFFSDLNITSMDVYYFFFEFVVPALVQAKFEIVLSMVFFALLPYITVFYKGFLKKRKKIRNIAFYNNY